MCFRDATFATFYFFSLAVFLESSVVSSRLLDFSWALEFLSIVRLLAL